VTSKSLDWSYSHGTVPGYGACRAVPGEYACLLPGRYVESSFSGFTGQAQLPGEDVNYLRIPHKPGDGRIAGGGQTTDNVLEWDVNHWAVRPGRMWGPNALVYGCNDVLVCAPDRSQYLLTSGWYYGYGALVAASANRANIARGIYEYIDFGDVAIGQGVDGRAVVSFRASTGGYEPLRALPIPAPCDARFMLTDRTGDQFGITAVNLANRHTYLFWPKLAELYDLPKETA
jgi:hypothetical protein